MPGCRYNTNLHAFLRNVALSPHSALLLDYDGTLAPFRTERDQAYPYPGIPELVSEILETGRTRVAFITGRRAHELRSLLDISPAPEIWGTYGVERLRTDGTYYTREIDSATRDALDHAQRCIDNLHLSHRLEQKPGTLAIHWRGLPDDEIHEIRGQVLSGWLPIADRASLIVEDFDGGVEIRSALCSKADVVRTILSHTHPEAPVAYLGDDVADEQVFDALHGRGLRVLVRPHWRDTTADLWLRPPEQLMEFLADWLKACRAAPKSQPHLTLMPTAGEGYGVRGA